MRVTIKKAVCEPVLVTPQPTVISSAASVPAVAVASVGASTKANWPAAEFQLPDHTMMLDMASATIRMPNQIPQAG